MTIRQVRAGKAQAVSPVPLQLSWQATGGGTQSVELRIERVDTPGHPAHEVKKLDGDRRLITALHAPIAASVRPIGSGVFPDGTRIDLQLATSGGADEYAMPSLDVSGVQVATLFTLSPEAGMWTLLVPGATPAGTGDGGGDRRPGHPQPTWSPDLSELPPAAQSAAYRLRELAGPSGAVGKAARAVIHLAVDRSASMLPHVRSGTRRTLMEIVLGINAGIGLAREVPVWQLGRSAEPVGQPLSRETVAGYDDHLGQVPYTTGTALAPVVRATSGGSQPKVVIVVSDGAPADVDDLRAALAEEADGSTRWHLLALARSSDDPEVVADPWMDELQALWAVDSPLFSYSAITPRQLEGEGWLERALADGERGREAMRRLVAGLGLLGGGG